MTADVAGAAGDQDGFLGHSVGTSLLRARMGQK
jgi:hypothetical protein